MNGYQNNELVIKLMTVIISTFCWFTTCPADVNLFTSLNHLLSFLFLPVFYLYFSPSIHLVLLCFLLLWVMCAAPQEQVGLSVFSL